MASLELIDQLLGNRETRIARDLKLNLKNLVAKSALSAIEAGILLRGLAATFELEPLKEIGGLLIGESGETLSEEQLQEVTESAGIMGMLNIYYRFRHFMNDGHEPNPVYQNTGLRMTALANPSLGKARFELLAFAHSVANGCQMCVTSHEKSLLELGVSPEKIHDTARLTAVVKGISTLLQN